MLFKNRIPSLMFLFLPELYSNRKGHLSVTNVQNLIIYLNSKSTLKKADLFNKISVFKLALKKVHIPKINSERAD